MLYRILRLRIARSLAHVYPDREAEACAGLALPRARLPLLVITDNHVAGLHDSLGSPAVGHSLCPKRAARNLESGLTMRLGGLTE